MKLREIGEVITKRVTTRICGECDCVIESTGMCSYGCSQDGNLTRSPGTVIIRVWERTDKLVDQKIK